MSKIAEKWPNLDFGPPENGEKSKNPKIQSNVFLGPPIDHVCQISASGVLNNSRTIDFRLKKKYRKNGQNCRKNGQILNLDPHKKAKNPKIQKSKVTFL